MTSTTLAVQYVAVALAVVVSAGVVLHKQSPSLSRRVRMWIAIPLAAANRPLWIQKLGRWIAPPSLQAGACGGCDGCGPAD